MEVPNKIKKNCHKNIIGFALLAIIPLIIVGLIQVVKESTTGII